MLILSTQEAASVPVLTNADGREDKDFNFEIDEEAEVNYSCSLTWQNELYVFGGLKKKTQISKVTSCRLAPIGQLKFSHLYGDCVNVAGNAVVLCFNSPASGDYKKCRMASSPTGAFSEMTLSQYEHKWTRIATNDGKFYKTKFNYDVFTSELIIAVGSYSPSNKRAELLDVIGNTWSTVDEYPFDWGLTYFLFL